MRDSSVPRLPDALVSGLFVLSAACGSTPSGNGGTGGATAGGSSAVGGAAGSATSGSAGSFAMGGSGGLQAGSAGASGAAAGGGGGGRQEGGAAGTSGGAASGGASSAGAAGAGAAGASGAGAGGSGGDGGAGAANTRPRVIVTTDGEADDQSSMVRFLLYTNEFDVQGLINSSSQFHWQGGEGWNALHPVDWISDYIDLYAQVYENLIVHDSRYPTPEYLRSQWKVGNVSAVGEDDVRTAGAIHIANVLLDSTDERPIWLQAWGGTNTISRALKIIQEDHPGRTEEVAAKLRLYLIWEQDECYQEYIRPNWEALGIPVIIADQFDCIAYIWDKVLPAEVKGYFQANWTTTHLLNGHGPLLSGYRDNNGAFNAEGDTPAFLHAVPSGLRSLESPGFGGFGGRFVRVRNNVWMDPPPSAMHQHPDDRVSIHNSWSKMMEDYSAPADVAMRTNYFKPIWRWLAVVQNDFAARADWCVEDYDGANHPPTVRLSGTELDIESRAGATINLDASASEDPDGDTLSFRWWHYTEAGDYSGSLAIANPNSSAASFTIPEDARGKTLHLVAEVSDSGSPVLTRYARVVVHVL